MMIYEITIPNWRPPLTNELLTKHWSQAARMKSGAAQMIAAYLQKAKVPGATGKRKVEIHITQIKGRFPDPDAPHKSVHDALTRTGYLMDDSQEWLDFTPARYSRGKKSTTIRIEDLP